MSVFPHYLWWALQLIEDLLHSFKVKIRDILQSTANEETAASFNQINLSVALEERLKREIKSSGYLPEF